MDNPCWQNSLVPEKETLDNSDNLRDNGGVKEGRTRVEDKLSETDKNEIALFLNKFIKDSNFPYL
jgi:hypothetical protein